MPTVTFEGEELAVPEGFNLRRALIKLGRRPHNGAAKVVCCYGMGTCGTCAVEVQGDVRPAEPGGRERWRLSFPPHRPERGLRLACQVRVYGDVVVKKHPGFWGQHTNEGATS
ncbi:MAG: 2Fe-2S iron-sulfur cluster-binding protein [Myxococcota bacterium]